MHVQFNEKGYLERGQCENPMDLSIELESYSMHEQVDCIEDQYIIILNVNIGLQGSKPSGEVGKKTFSSNIDSSRKPVSFARTISIYFIECSSAQLLVQATIK